MNSESDTVDDEVTFLLRLRPTPSPPVRQKRNNPNIRCESNCQSATTNGWDIFIEPSGTRSHETQRKDFNATILKSMRKKIPQLPNILRKKDVGRAIDWEVSLEVPGLTQHAVLPTAPPQEELEKTMWYYPTVLTNGSNLLPRSDELSCNKCKDLCETNILFTDINWCSPEFNFHKADIDTSRAEVIDWSFQKDSNAICGISRNDVPKNNCTLDQQHRSCFGITQVSDVLKMFKTSRSESTSEIMVSGFALGLS